ncbi:hypothetical protein [Acetivibrio cellulolyticus]|uniref:hypothetical protein n=1 Tax=Acetivibrio cellulolyticus TaxID=35830 RepID=UPI0001E2D899|nr:hypothetical protein [Acetivibrio cellulolyticus]
MRINLFIAFAISSFMCTKAFIASASFADQKPYWLFIFPLIFLLSAIFYKKVSFFKNTVTKIFLALFTAIPYLAFLFFITICLIHPAEKDFQAKLTPVSASVQEIDSGKQLHTLLDGLVQKIDTDEKTLISNFDTTDLKNEKITAILSKTKDDRIKIFQYINSNSIAIPNNFSEEELTSSAQESADNEIILSAMVTLFKIELLEINKLRFESKNQEAVDKYINSWHEAKEVLSLKNTKLVDSLCHVAIVKLLGEYFFDNQDFFINYDLTEVANLKDDIFNNLDKSFESAFTNEYTISKISSDKAKDAWPLYDINLEQRKLDGLYYFMIQTLKNPCDNSLTYEEPIDTSNYNFFMRPYNAIGEVLYSINVNMYSGLIGNIFKNKNALSVYFYGMDKNNYQDIPINFATGEKLIVKNFPDRIEIEAAHSKNSESSPQKFKLIKSREQ